MRRVAVALVVTAAVSVVAASACSSGTGKSASTTTRAATPSTTAAGATSALPTVPTTTIPAGATLPPASSGATTPGAPTSSASNPGAGSTPGATAPAATTPGATTPGATTPGATTPAAGNASDGDPTRFCPAVEKAIPLYFVVSIGTIDGGQAAANAEVATAPLLSPPLTDAASSAPSVLAAPFKRWADRTAKALDAFKQTGATQAQIDAFVKSYQSEIDSLSQAGGTQSPPDPVDTAAKAGIDTGKLATAAAGFVKANGAFDQFAQTLGKDVTLTTAAEQQLEQTYTCASDLGTFASNQ